MILNVTTGTGFKGILSYVEKQEKKELRPLDYFKLIILIE